MTSIPDFSNVGNPYDFSHPVLDPSIFSGRETLIEEIHYYLDLASNGARPMNLALLGPRASGKTSLLNMIAHEAKERDYAVARIDLNEGDIQSSMAFLFKIFDSVFGSACDMRIAQVSSNEQFCFGGREGRTYDAYLDMINAYVVPDDRTWRPFGFPVAYAKAMANNNAGALVSEPQFSRDLALIAEHVRRPILILIDEGNVLAGSRHLLQQVRNIFMNLPGYMLVISGTPEMFPIMNDVFSPISRDFKRFPIGRFESESEAEDCVLKPLRSIGVSDPVELFDFETVSDLRNPNGLAEASPYQIQLICHFLFKEIQQGRAQQMVLSVDVLDAVLNEIGRDPDLRQNPTLSALQALSDQELRSLADLSVMNGRASIEQIHLFHSIGARFDDTFQDRLQHDLQTFVNTGLIEIEGDRIKFAGDERETMYAKYFGRKRGIRNLAQDVAPEEMIPILIGLELGFATEWQPLGLPVSAWGDQNANAEYVDAIAGLLSGAHSDSAVLSRAIHWVPRGLIADLYGSILDIIAIEAKHINIAYVEMSSTWLNRDLFLLSDSVTSKTTEEVDDAVRELALRVRPFGIEISTTIREYRAPTLDELIQQVPATSNSRLLRVLTQFHLVRMHEQYLEKNDRRAAFMHRDAANRFGSKDLDPGALSNLGYLYLAEGDLQRAEEVLVHALGQNPDKATQCLIEVNLGATRLVLDQIEAAYSHFQVASELSSGFASDDLAVGCLMLPTFADGSVKLEEIFNPSIVDVALAGTSVAVQSAKHRKICLSEPDQS